MSVRSLLFPRPARSFYGERWLNVLLRTTHLVGVAGLGGGFLYPALDQSWQLYLQISVISGLGLILISLYSSLIWLLQLRGQVILLKLLLLLLIPALPDYKAALLITVVVLSGWIAHATSGVRYYSIWHGRKLDSL
ncbi:MAG: hypothetical protein MI754_10665 [Chromatiales bacterium]|nr:hypothetical protein [Chromatiales bacterium]